MAGCLSRLPGLNFLDVFSGSKIEFDRELDDPLIPRAVVLSEIGPKHRRAVRWAEIVGYRKSREVAEDRIPGLTRTVHDVRRQIVARELWMVEDVERLHADQEV